MSPASKAKEVLVIYWEWISGPHKGAKFWGAHSVDGDGRVSDWPKNGLSALGAAKVLVTEGKGLDLLRNTVTEDAAQ